MPVSLPISESSGLPLDPMTLQALQEQQLSQQVNVQGGTSAERANTMASQQAIQSLFPSPQMQQANKVQQALKDAQVTQNPGESQLDFNIRQLQAQRDAVARYSPESAAALNTQLTKLAEVQFQQSKLTAEDQRQATAAADVHARETALLPAEQAKGQFAQATGTLGYLVRSGQDGQMTATAFDATNSDALAAAKKQAESTGGVIVDADKASDMMKSNNTGLLSMQRALAAANMQYGQLDADTVRHMALDNIFNPGAVPYRGPAKVLVEKWYSDNGILPTDIAGAKLEYKALQSAATAAGSRQGRMDYLTNEIQPLGQAVLNALPGVTRFDATFVNRAIRAGASAFSDPGEARLAAALQSYVNTYARVINGGTGQTSDSARQEAMDVLNKNLGPGGMKAAINQLSNVETGAIMNASDAAVAMIRDPGHYKSLWKLQEKAGYSVLPTQGDTDAVSAGGGTPPAPANRPPLASFGQQ